MIASRTDYHALGMFISVTLLAGCGGLQLQSATISTPSHPALIVSNGRASNSWMLAEAKAEDLLYISDSGYSSVDVFTYPAGQEVGALGAVVPEGLCVDHAGDVFVTDMQISEILEYAHGGEKPIETLYDRGAYGEDFAPIGCAVDSRTGNLAVTNIDTTAENVVIYRKAQGPPKAYSIPYMDSIKFCAYDNVGNLYVDGENYGQFEFAELPFRAKGFTEIHLNKSVELAGGVQWDGKYVAIGDSQAGVVYHVKVAGSNGMIVGSTALSGSKEVVQFWIQGRRLVGPDLLAANVGLWRYPAGGAAEKTITGFADPFGATISLAK